MQKLILSALIMCVLSNFAFSQVRVTWDGGGVDNSFDTAENWDNDIVPANGDTVTFTSNAFVGGTASTIPAAITVAENVNLFLQTSLVVGDGSQTIASMFIGSGSLVRIDDGASLTLNAGTGFGVNISGGSDGASLVVRAAGALTVSGGQNGINQANATSMVENKGTILINAPSSIGVRNLAGAFNNEGTMTITGAATGVFSNGSFTNSTVSGSITVQDATNIGISVETTGTLTNSASISITNPGGVTTNGMMVKGSVTNEAAGTIAVSAMQDDGVDMREGSFQNDGTLNITMRSGATNGNAGIVVGTATTAANLTNTSNNSLNFTGAASGPTISVAEMGSVLNTGTITAAAGAPNRRIFSRGVIENGLGGTIDLTDGRAVITSATGSLTNNGLMKNTYNTTGGTSGANSGINSFNGGSSINNAFFEWENSNAFSNGNGTVTDLGINLTLSTSFRIDGDGSDMIDIAETPYTWEFMGTPIGTADATGLLTIDCSVLDNDTVFVRAAEFDEPVSVRLQNVCTAALPIELVSLRAVGGQKSVMVQWETAAEIDNDYIAVERSSDGINFSEIGRLAARGQEVYGAYYELEDEFPYAGINYYRLRQVDLDGTLTHSRVVSAAYEGSSLYEDGASLRLYPTVITRGQAPTVELSPTATETVDRMLILSDANGRQLAQFTLSVGQQSIELPISNLTAGMYILTDASGSVRQSSVRFIVR